MTSLDLREAHRREADGPLLEVEDLPTFFFTKEGVVKAVNGVSLELRQDTILGVVGESGSGKTATALSIVGLVPHPGRIVEGSIRYKGRELTGLRERDLRTIPGARDIAGVPGRADGAEPDDAHPGPGAGGDVRAPPHHEGGGGRPDAEAALADGDRRRAAGHGAVPVPDQRRDGAADRDGDGDRAGAAGADRGRARRRTWT